MTAAGRMPGPNGMRPVVVVDDPPDALFYDGKLVVACSPVLAKPDAPCVTAGESLVWWFSEHGSAPVNDPVVDEFRPGRWVLLLEAGQ